MDATQGLLIQALKDFGWLPKWISLGRALEIIHAGVVDSFHHVSMASNATRVAVSELRVRLLEASESSTHHDPLNIPSTYSDPRSLHLGGARLVPTFALLQASYFLSDITIILKSLEEDLLDLVEVADLDRRLRRTICPIELADAWLQTQHHSHDAHAKHLRRVRAEAKKLLDRVGGDQK